MTVKIGRPATALEQKAIEARLQKLGLTIDPETNEIAEADAKRSKVKGGVSGLQRAQGSRPASSPSPTTGPARPPSPATW